VDKIKKFLAEKPQTARAAQRLVDRTLTEPKPVTEGITLERVADIMARMGKTLPKTKH
jgi:hypothetical protein